jgi:hypothetical protein
MGTGGVLTDDMLSDESLAALYGCMFKLAGDSSIIVGMPRDSALDDCKTWRTKGTLLPSAKPIGYLDVCYLTYRASGSLPASLGGPSRSRLPGAVEYGIRVWGASVEHTRDVCVAFGSDQTSRPTVVFYH